MSATPWCGRTVQLIGIKAESRDATENSKIFKGFLTQMAITAIQTTALLSPVAAVLMLAVFFIGIEQSFRALIRLSDTHTRRRTTYEERVVTLARRCLLLAISIAAGGVAFLEWLARRGSPM